MFKNLIIKINMKVYITNKTIEKIKNMYETQKPGSVSVRKYKKGSDPETNSVQGLKLNDKQREAHKSGKSYSLYISKERLKEVAKYMATPQENGNDRTEKTGGFLPLIGLILAGIGTAAGVATGVAKTVLDKQANDKKIEEEQRHNIQMESAARGEGIYLYDEKEGNSICPKKVIQNFSNKIKTTDDTGKKAIRNFLKNLSDHVKIKQKKNGLGLYLYDE